MNIPLVNHYIGRNASLQGTIGAKATNGGLGETWVLCYPVYLVPGETTLEVEVSLRFDQTWKDLRPTLQVFSTGNVLQQSAAFDVVTQIGEPDSVLMASVSGLTSAAVYYVAVVLDTSTTAELACELNYCRIRPRMPSLGTGIDGDFKNYDPGSAPPLRDANDFGITTPASTEGLAHRNFATAMFSSQAAIDGWTTTSINRNLNALAEYITGWPAGGNATYVQQDQDGSGLPDATNPARVRFEYHSRALYTSEGQVAFPVWSECFGAFIGGQGKFAVDLAQPPTEGILQWYAPWPSITTALGLRSVMCLMPDFQSTSSTLCAHILLGSDASAAVGNWTFQIQTTTGNSAAVAPVHCDTSNTLWKVDITGIPFTGDSLEEVTIVSQRTGAKSGIGELCMIGATLFFTG